MPICDPSAQHGRGAAIEYPYAAEHQQLERDDKQEDERAAHSARLGLSEQEPEQAGPERRETPAADARKHTHSAPQPGPVMDAYILRLVQTGSATWRESKYRSV